MNDTNGIIGEITAEEMEGLTKLIPTKFVHHASPDAVKTITEEFKLSLMEVYPDKKIVNEENTKEK